MQNRYAGDVGDYIKLSLLRALSARRLMGVLWYTYPDETHNSDGAHTKYLEAPSVWRHLDMEVFDLLDALVRGGSRSIEGLRGVLAQNTLFVADDLPVGLRAASRSVARKNWFRNACSRLSGCDLVFADPDNGLVDDQEWRRQTINFGKQLPLSEALSLSEGRCAVIYHHNSRFKGGHDAEVDYWLSQLAMPALAVRATAYSCRTFFIVNPDAEIVERAHEFCRRWENHKVRLHQSPIM